MPNHQRHPAPHEQLGILAAEAKRAGIPFEEFWQHAVRPNLSPIITSRTPDPPGGVIIWPHDSTERKATRAAAEEVKDVWRRCYEDEPPTNGEIAFLRLHREIFTGGSESRSALASAA